MTTQLMPSRALAQQVRHEVHVCKGPCIRHRSPVQHMFAVDYRGHRVSVTADGDRYNVRIDNDILKTAMGLTEAELVAFVERSCN